tara:strand:+ start:421 stop:1206 length:786 start_codon:yes stop_codon:yes gene_type:complete
MKLINSGLDKDLTYFEHNLNSSETANIFIHGVGLDNTMWLPQKKFFSKTQVVFYDLLNHGKSKRGYSDINFDHFSHQLSNLINFLNLKKINLIGFSIGALIAQHFALKNQQKLNKLIIIASVYDRSKKQIEKVKKRYKAALKGANISDDSINRWFNLRYLKKNPSVYNFFYELLNKKKSEDFLPAYKLFVESDNYHLDFSYFKIPTLIMTGKNEVGSTPKMSEKLHKKIENSKLYIIPNAKHMASFEKHETVNKKIKKFID